MPITTPNYYAVPNPTFQRAMRNILSISQGTTTIITTTYDGVNPGVHQYMTGLIIRLIIPAGFGMVLRDPDSLYPITVLSSSTFSIPLDSSVLDTFVIPSYNPGHFGTPAQVVPVGEVNSILTEATQNILNNGLIP